ncbi:MAG: polysaccharide deacetylase family protein [Aquabacterium sp.]
MRRAPERLRGAGLAVLAVLAVAASAAAGGTCSRPLYLTFDTGHMGVAPLVAEVLARHDVKATFFLAAERTLDGGHSLDEKWAPWWRQRAAEGHAFASHTWDHGTWQADTPVGFRVRPSQGPQAGKTIDLTPTALCAELARPEQRLREMTGQAMLALFRAPGGRTSERLLEAARGCGWQHVGWSPAGFLGDELPSDRFPNEALRQRALRDIRAGDILLAHLGIWSRRDPWAPAVLEPLIVGLKARGFCFATLRDHPVHGRAGQR